MIKLLAPISGRAIELNKVIDEAFAQEILGPGMAIEPFAEEVLAPFDGRISMLATSKHALSVVHESGLEILIHIGIDTVGHMQSIAETLVSEGDMVEAGQPLIRFDLFDLAMRGARALTTPVIISNRAWDYCNAAVPNTKLKAGVDALYYAKLKGTQGGPLEEDITDESPELRGTTRITNIHGLHARPAGRLANFASSFASRIRICGTSSKGEHKDVSAKSPTAIMGASFVYDSEVTLVAQGSDAAEAIEALIAFINEGCGESPDPNCEAPNPTKHITDIAARFRRQIANPEQLKPFASGVETHLRGIVVAEGRVKAPAALYVRKAIDLKDAEGNCDHEWQLIQKLLAKMTVLIKRDIEEAIESGNNTAEEIFDAHLSILEDEDIAEGLKDAVYAGKSAGQAWSETFFEVAEDLSESENLLMAERSMDILDLRRRGLCTLYAIDDEIAQVAQNIKEGFILVSDELWPSEFMRLVQGKRLAGLAFVQGSRTAHASILAKAYRIPTVVNLGPRILQVAEGHPVEIDGSLGEFVVGVKA